MTRLAASQLAFALVFLGAITISNSWGRKQTVGVRGKVVCPTDPGKAANIKIILVDEDTGPDPDDVMAETRTARDGSFQLSGSESEWSRIDPFLKIYHDCMDGWKPCQRKWKLGIPNQYINNRNPYDMGVVNLEMRLPDEERDCIH